MPLSADTAVIVALTCCALALAGWVRAAVAAARLKLQLQQTREAWAIESMTTLQRRYRAMNEPQRRTCVDQDRMD